MVDEAMNADGITCRGFVEKWFKGNSKDRVQNLNKGIIPFTESIKVDDLLFFLNERAYYFVAFIINMGEYSRIS